MTFSALGMCRTRIVFPNFEAFEKVSHVSAYLDSRCQTVVELSHRKVPLYCEGGVRTLLRQ